MKLEDLIKGIFMPPLILVFMIILILFTQKCHAQSTQTNDNIKLEVLQLDTNTHIKLVKPNHKGRWIEYALFTAAVVSNAVGDGENSREHYESGHTLNALSIGCMLAIPLVSKPS